jgi:prepilin-type N-terminal cleavage/methylation domain-containing protein
MNVFKNKRRKGKGQSGFSLIELLLGSAIMLIVILGALALYVRSNKVSVDQQQFAEVQHDVRASMYFISRDVRMAGVGLSPDISGYFLEGQDHFGPNPEISDTIRLVGNFDDPLALRIRQYQGGGGGGAATAFLYDYELENAPYDCPGFYENKAYLIISTTCPGCYTFRFIPNNAVHGCGSGTAHIDFQPGQSELNPPGGLIDLPWCGASCWDDAIITFGQIKFYWLDTTGLPGDYPGLANLDTAHGYLGLRNVLYVTTNGPAGAVMHMPLAMNIENLQFEYNGDFNDDQHLDGFRSWDNANWTILPGDDDTTRQTKGALISRITEVKMWILGKTPNPVLTVGRRVPVNLDLYRRPAISNSPRASQDDFHRRFVLESTSNIRNLSLTIYNTGAR